MTGGFQHQLGWSDAGPMDVDLCQGSWVLPVPNGTWHHNYTNFRTFGAILLGANGDICSVLPLLRHWSVVHGRPVPLLVSQPYLPMLHACSYVRPMQTAWHYSELAEATKTHAMLGNLPIIAQAFNSPRPRRMGNFVHEMWANLFWDPLAPSDGCGKLPLIFDRPNRAEEDQLNRDYDGDIDIILALDGKSSPLPQAEALAQSILSVFRGRNILNLAPIKVKTLASLVALYRRAKVIVTIDTLHYHLSQAAPDTPVIALANDSKDPWLASPAYPNQALRVPYSQFDRLHWAILETISRLL